MRYYPALFFLFVAFLFTPVTAVSQTPRWETGALLGASFYSGDITAAALPYLPETHFAGGLFFRRYFTPRWSVRLSGMFSELSNSDLNYTTPIWRSSRAFSFSTNIIEGSLLAEWSPWATETNTTTFFPYLFAGGGILYYDPRPVFDRTKLEGLLERIASDKTALHPETQFILPLGAGLRWEPHKNWYLGIEGSLRILFTDRIDGISQSANPANDDGYAFANIIIGFRLGNEKVKAIAGRKGRLKQKLPDGDGDGIADEADFCPDQRGLSQFGGCPDTDGDGIPDLHDGCPNEPGLATRNGCPPPDRDGDGIEDARDACPDQVGLAEYKGCPADQDIDGDRVPDHKDRCPREFGVVILSGCPDADNDGIADIDDACPTVFGAYANKGCPLELSMEQEIAWLSEQVILFAAGSDSISNPALLDQVALFMIENPDYRLMIEGHADAEGDENVNMQLSQRRARACQNYLIEQGIPSARLRVRGYGSTQPARNSSPGSVQMNRRVHFVLYERG